MSVLPVGFGSSGGLQIANSVRLRASASAYFSRTFGNPTSNTTWTLSFWHKKSANATSGNQNIFANAGSENDCIIFTNSTDTLRFIKATAVVATSTAVFRDPSAHYHFCFVSNGTTVKGYRNNEEVISYTGTIPELNKNATAFYLGARSTGIAGMDGYLSDYYFIDGQALTPSSFGETNSDGVWVPKVYTGTYGTNGFHLDFKDAALTAGSNAGLGKDVSGNGNYWNTNNISVTAGVTYDSMVDTPTNNYATLNPLSLLGNTFSEANLKTTCTTNTKTSSSVALPTTGKWYWECVWVTNGGASSPQVGIISQVATATGANDNLWYRADGQKYDETNTASAYGSTWAVNDVLGIAVDMDAGTLVFYKNNTSQGTAFSTITSRLSGSIFPCVKGNVAGDVWVTNFGQRPFTYTPPTGFKSLCTANRTGTITVSGTFTGNAAADGPFVWIGGVPTVLTINGNAVTFGTHADKTAGGFKLRTASASYNTAGSNTWTATATMNFGTTSLAPAPAQGNP